MKNHDSTMALNAVVLSVANKPIMLSVVMLNVKMLSVVAPMTATSLTFKGQKRLTRDLTFGTMCSTPMSWFLHEIDPKAHLGNHFEHLSGTSSCLGHTQDYLTGTSVTQKKCFIISTLGRKGVQIPADPCQDWTVSGMIGQNSCR